MKGRKAKLLTSELVEEISKRTGFPATGIVRVLKAWNEIAFECVTNDVEFPLGDMGFMTFQKVAPVERAEWQSWFKYNKGEWMVKEHVSGYNKVLIRFNAKFKKMVKDATEVPYEEKE